MACPGRSGAIGAWLWFLGWAVAASVWCTTAAGRLGPTYDEVFYIRYALEERWRSGSHETFVNLGVMPLPMDVQTLPLYLWERWHGIQLDTGAGLDALLPWARAGTLPFLWLLLFSGWRLGQRLGGPWGGALAVALLAAEPTILAHAGLATTDLALSACLLTLVLTYHNGRRADWGRRVGLPAFWFGLAVLAKASALVFGPLCLLAVDFCGGLEDGIPGSVRGWPRLWRRAGDMVQVVLWALPLVVFYCGNDRPLTRPLAHAVPWLAHAPGGQVLLCLAEHVRSWNNALNCVLFQVGHNLRGRPVYLLGETRLTSFWYYFPLALTIKLTVPVLVLAAGLTLLRPRALLNGAFLAAVLLLLYSPSYRVQTGVRFVLPLVCLALCGLAGAAGQVRARLTPGWRSLFAAGLAAGVGWMVAAAVTVWPHGLCYTNELWGGTRNGYRYLSDSNYDWGQGIPELTAWQQQQGMVPLDVWYFGTDPALQHLPLRRLDLLTMPLQRPAQVLEQVRGHYLAVSMTFVYGYGRYCPAGVFLRDREPVARTQTFLIYDFTHEEPGSRR